MPICQLAVLLLSVTFAVGYRSVAQVHEYQTTPTPSPSAPERRTPTAKDIQDLCNRVSEIKLLPIKQEFGSDATYTAFMEAGVGAVPCLIDKITDETPMADPRQAPKYNDTRVGDVAYFLIMDITQIGFVMLMPPEVQAKYPDQGVYAYFEFVEKPKNRKLLQENLRVWYRETFPDSLPQRP